MDLYQVGDIPLKKITERIAKLKSEKDGLMEEIADKDDSKITVSKAKDLLTKAKDIFENGDLPKQRLYVNSLIDYIEIDNNEISLHFSFC